MLVPAVGTHEPRPLHVCVWVCVRLSLSLSISLSPYLSLSLSLSRSLSLPTCIHLSMYPIAPLALLGFFSSLSLFLYISLSFSLYIYTYYVQSLYIFKYTYFFSFFHYPALLSCSSSSYTHIFQVLPCRDQTVKSKIREPPHEHLCVHKRTNSKDGKRCSSTYAMAMLW